MVDIMDYFQIILKPDATMQRLVKKPDMKAADQAYLLYGGIIGLVFGLVVALLASVVSTFASIAGQGVVALIAGLGFLAVIIFPILFAIVGLVGAKISYWIFHQVMVLLGGKGTYEQSFWIGSQLLWPVLFAQIIVWILGVIPFIGALISLAWFLYSVYLFVVLFSIVHKFSKLRALVGYIAGIIVILIIVVIIFAIIGGAVFSGIGYN